MKRRTYNYTESKILKTIGERIATERKKAGLSQFELARKSGIHQATLTKIEDGKVNASVIILELITRVLQIHILI